MDFTNSDAVKMRAKETHRQPAKFTPLVQTRGHQNLERNHLYEDDYNKAQAYSKTSSSQGARAFVQKLGLDGVAVLGQI
jgi:hypothetical protein